MAQIFLRVIDTKERKEHDSVKLAEFLKSSFRDDI
jgi:hypothetical protein